MRPDAPQTAGSTTAAPIPALVPLASYLRYDTTPFLLHALKQQLSAEDFHLGDFGPSLPADHPLRQLSRSVGVLRAALDELLDNRVEPA